MCNYISIESIKGVHTILFYSMDKKNVQELVSDNPQKNLDIRLTISQIK
jgi:hypothetical protein